MLAGTMQDDLNFGRGKMSNDKRFQWLRGEGYEGSYNDMEMKYFLDQGFTGSVTDMRAQSLGGLITLPFEAYDVIGGVFSAATANLTDKTLVTLFTAFEEDTDVEGEILFGESDQIRITTLPITGEHWLHTEFETTSGSIRARLLSPTYKPNGTRSYGGNQIWKFPDTDSNVMVNFFTGSGALGKLKSIQLVDMEDILTQPWDIYIAAGQSNMAATTVATEIDPTLDYWSSSRLLQWVGSTDAVRGHVKDTINALTVPLQMAPATDEATDDGYTAGVSPAIAFAKEIEASTVAGRNVVVVGAAWSGTGLVGASAPWNSGGSDPYAYNNAVSRTLACLAAAPNGSVVKAVLWGQGESDVSNMASYPASFAAMRSDFEDAVNGGIQLPWIICNGLPDGVAGTQDIYIQTMKDMATGSGHANEQPKVYTVSRDTGYVTDGTHSDATGNRIVGRRAGEKAVEEGINSEPIYTAVVPSMTADTDQGFVVSSSSIQSGFDPYKSFDSLDNSTSSYWLSQTSSLPVTLEIQLDAVTPVFKYTIDHTTVAGRFPSAWTFEGSDNGTDWAVLDTRTGETGGSAHTEHEYYLPLPANYNYYRWNISANNGDTRVAVGTVQLYTLE